MVSTASLSIDSKDGPPPVHMTKSPRAISMTKTSSVLSQVQILCGLIGLLLVPIKYLFAFMYHSTDFEVHRNWLAITHSLPMSRWYFDTTSEWTLDYPPFFAYFEKMLSVFAFWFDPAIVDLTNLNYSSDSCVLFQRTTVIVSDFVLIFAAYRVITGPVTTLLPAGARLCIFLLLVCNVGLFFVDHIHFQYNGWLMGVLLLCVDAVQRGQDTRVTLYFSLLVLAKHLFATLAPIFAVYLLRRALDRATDNADKTFQFDVVYFISIMMGHVLVALLCLGVAFVPFFLSAIADESSKNDNTGVALSFAGVLYSATQTQVQQMLKRLFPFARGLVHAYWAPNIWAIYLLFDKLLFTLHQWTLKTPHFLVVFCSRHIALTAETLLRLTQLNTHVNRVVQSTVAFFLSFSGVEGATQGVLPSSSSGLVGDFALHVLPRVDATHCLLLTLTLFVPIATRLFFFTKSSRDTPRSFQRAQCVLALRCCVVGSFTAFLCGYHVHEKAILSVWLLQSLLVFETDADKVVFSLVSAAGCVSLFPLLPGTWEWYIKVLLTVAFHKWTWYVLDMQRTGLSIQRGLTACYLMLGLLVTYTDILHPLTYADKLPFFPLMLTSCFCAFILIAAYMMSFVALLFAK